MNFENICRTDIDDKKEFKFDGDTLKFKEKFDNGFYWYERFNDRGIKNGNEIVLPRKVKNSDGSIVRMYPSSEMFGQYGWYYPPQTSREELYTKSEEIIAHRRAKKQKH